MKLLPLLVLCALASPYIAQAEIYKRVDAQGHVTYSSVPIKGAKKLHLEPLPVTTAPAVRVPPPSFPSVDSNTQRRRDEARRKILEDELATEEQILAEARTKLAEGEANPEIIRGADGQAFRNVAKYEEKVNALQNDVRTHERNVEALKSELANLK